MTLAAQCSMFQDKVPRQNQILFFFNKNIYIHKYIYLHMDRPKNQYDIKNKFKNALQNSSQSTDESIQDLIAWSLGKFSICLYKMTDKIFLCGAGCNDQQNSVWSRPALAF